MVCPHAALLLASRAVRLQYASPQQSSKGVLMMYFPGKHVFEEIESAMSPDTWAHISCRPRAESRAESAIIPKMNPFFLEVTVVNAKSLASSLTSCHGGS